MSNERGYKLDPVTFEVLRNAFTTLVDEMSEQILRTCHSFVMYCRDFSCALCDADGNTVAQGTQDIASHVGTLHLTAKAVLESFEGDIHPGDVFALNDPYVGGTHFSDVRVVRPVFVDDQLVALTQSCGHWADVGGSVPGSFDLSAKEHFKEGLRIPPVRIWDKGVYRADVVELITSNTRAPDDAEGDLVAQATATAVGEQELRRLIDKYGSDTVLQAFADVQDYVEHITRRRLAELPDGEWTTEDYLDYDPGVPGEGLVPVKVRMVIEGDTVHYDLHGSHGVIGCMLNSAFGGTFSAIVAGMKTFFPDIPLNSGFYRPISTDLPEDSVVNAPWPIAVSGFAMPYEKVFSSLVELWSSLVPERAMACSFNIEYLEVGGRDLRSPERPFFMWYDWMVGGWGGRAGRDGVNASSGVFCAGLIAQPVEGQERLCPVVHSVHELLTDSGGPGTHRGGLGLVKGGRLSDNDDTVVSYEGDRERSIVWGLRGGAPSNPMGVWYRGEDDAPWRRLGAAFADVPVPSGVEFMRPSSGGGGYGDPLERAPADVLEDVIDEYVSVDRAEKDYGVVITRVADGPPVVDEQGTLTARAAIREARPGWLAEDAEHVASRFRAGELDSFDVIRRYGVIVDWETGELLASTTQTFRAMLGRRMAAYWGDSRDGGPST